MRAVEITIEGLSAHRAAEKLRREGVRVLSARRGQKNALTVAVDANERKKVFAILRSSCYNVTDVRYIGPMRLLRAALRAAGMAAGCAVVLFASAWMQGRVLRVEVVGSGAYLEPQVRAILAECGVSRFSRPPSEREVMPAVLSLPRVGFCSMQAEGGVLRIRVEVDDEAVLPSAVPLRAPVSGTVDALTVIRGTPLVQVGDEVKEGDVVVDSAMLFQEERREVLVIARVHIKYRAEREYALPRERALLQGYLDFGEDAELSAFETEKGWRVEGWAYSESALNFG